MDLNSKKNIEYTNHIGYVCTDSILKRAHAIDKMVFNKKIEDLGGIVDSTSMPEQDPVSTTTTIYFRLPKGVELS